MSEVESAIFDPSPIARVAEVIHPSNGNSILSNSVMTPIGSRIPSLDGLRAVSIWFVLLGHLAGTRHSPVPLCFKLFQNFGVRIFFVISGYLITSLLIKEQERTGTISLRNFYIRRVFRIFPAAYLYITIIAIFSWDRLRSVDIAAAYAYLINYDLYRPRIVMHLWSLSVEEQFYLLWPLLCLLLYRWRTQIAILAIALGPTMRVLFYGLGYRDALDTFFPCVLDSLATGCLLSISRPAMDRLAKRIYNRWFFVVPLVTLSVPLWKSANAKIGGAATQIVGLTIMHIGIALCIDNAIRKKYWILNTPVMVWTGLVSYSLYLWQQPFTDWTSAPRWFTTFPTNLLLAFLFAAVSYYFVESPCLRLRERLFPQFQHARAASAD